ncbi:hypothetical protein GcM1_230064 [Golovinomyces cichoracearum]|uniref:Uncharacterized protein n=1 Tax=Golovinomyces cichoracearum TaxID=62708 RepID=A0A420INC9_9PEZI|nr:hypothetical protein GcM1_230064 [Golovinomyces cichoracearum]
MNTKYRIETSDAKINNKEPCTARVSLIPTKSLGETTEIRALVNATGYFRYLINRFAEIS